MLFFADYRTRSNLVEQSLSIDNSFVLFLDPKALTGFLIRLIVVGFMLALMMDNGGGVWNNAKKLIEQEEHGGKGSEAYRASIVGDTAGIHLRIRQDLHSTF